MILWREAWSTLTNEYLEAAGTEERIDHRSIDAQHNEALENAAITLDVEDKALWLAKATLTSRPPMQRIHRAKWNSKSVQENRAAEQAVRDEMKQEAQVTYRTFKDLDQQIIVDLKSFTVSELPEPVEIVLPETGSQSSSEDQQPVLIAPAPHARTKLRNPSSAKTRAGKRAPVKSKKKKLNLVRMVSSSVLLCWSWISSRRNLFGPRRSLLLLMLSTICVLLTTMSLMRCRVSMFPVLSLRNVQGLTVMTIYRRRRKSLVFQVATNRKNKILITSWNSHHPCNQSKPKRAMFQDYDLRVIGIYNDRRQYNILFNSLIMYHY